VLGRLNNPCHLEPCDLNDDGRTDLVVADLGSFVPDDHDRGRVVWLRAGRNPGTFEPIVLAEHLGRVADVRPVDVDGDRDLDLIVADFGLLRTGRIVLLRNVGKTDGVPRFEQQLIDDRPGAIHVPVHDWNSDGRPDFVALVSQEYESVDMFLNDGYGKFQARRLWAGPDLTFGSSGLEPSDLDRDGDLDILFSNGDSFDNMFVNSWHGLQWLENLGQLQFAYHRLADFTGAYRALPGDIDGDGDVDIVAVASVPPQPKPAGIDAQALPAIICLEQIRPGEFARHTLAQGSPCHATFEMADFDEDGDTDLAVGVHLMDMQSVSHSIAVWWNQTKKPSP
jgi:hypothetical protein